VLRSFTPERKVSVQKISGETPLLVEKIKSAILDLQVIT